MDGVWCSWRKRFKLLEHRASIDNIQRLSYQVINTLRGSKYIGQETQEFIALS